MYGVMASSRLPFPGCEPKQQPVRGSHFELGEKVSAGGVSSVTGSMPSNFGLNPDAPDAERRKGDT